MQYFWTGLATIIVLMILSPTVRREVIMFWDLGLRKEGEKPSKAK